MGSNFFVYAGYALVILALIVAVGRVVELAIIWGERVKRWRYQRKADHYIITVAKASGEWALCPPVLSGRALELLAKEYHIKRAFRETDEHLRHRVAEKQRAMIHKKQMMVGTDAWAKVETTPEEWEAAIAEDKQESAKGI